MKITAKTLLLACCCIGFTMCASANGPLNYSWGLIQNNNLCLEASGKKVLFNACNIYNKKQLWNYNNFNNLHFQNDDGELSESCIDIPTESKGKNNSALQLYPCGTSKSSQWMWERSGATNMVMRSRWPQATSMCLSQDKNKNAIISYCKNGQNWLALLSAQQKSGFDAFPQAALAYFNINKKHWMEEIFYDINNISIAAAVIPGSHNSGTYKGFYTVSKTQNLSAYDQLINGVRYLDVRVDKRALKGLVITHGIEGGKSGSFAEFLQEVSVFAYWHPREIIIIDLHEVPNLENSADSDGIKNYKDIIAIINTTIRPQLIKRHNSLSNITFGNLWSDQDTYNHRRNIILLAQNRKNFRTAQVGPTLDFLWDRSICLYEKWPQSTDFTSIYNQLKRHLSMRSERNNKLYLSQIIRTPTIAYGVGTVMGLNDGPFELTTEKTPDGYFNLLINSWLNKWVSNYNLRPNIVMTDFVDYTNIVDEAIWLNIKKKHQAMAIPVSLDDPKIAF